MTFFSSIALKLPFHFYKIKRWYLYKTSLCWPSFPHLTGLFLFVLLYQSCPIWILILAVSPQCQALSCYFQEVYRTGPRLLQHNHQILFYCCNSHLQMRTHRSPPSFSFCSQIVPLHFLVRNCGQCCTSAFSQGCQKPAACLPLPPIQMLKLSASGLSSLTWILGFMGICCHLVLQNKVCGYPSYSAFLWGDSKTILLPSSSLSSNSVRSVLQKTGFNKNFMVVMTEIIIRNLLFRVLCQVLQVYYCI